MRLSTRWQRISPLSPLPGTLSWKLLWYFLIFMSRLFPVLIFSIIKVYGICILYNLILLKNYGIFSVNPFHFFNKSWNYCISAQFQPFYTENQPAFWTNFQYAGRFSIYILECMPLSHKNERLVLYFNMDFWQMPDIIYILLNGSVRGEFTWVCNI